MANQEQVSILKQGWSAWNKWRNDHPFIRPDLSGAELTSADLSDCDLRKADLQEATLTYARLQRAWLWETKLHKADLREAKLEYASIWNADLIRVKLNKANLIGAQVWQTDLTEAELDGADLRMSHLIEVRLDRSSLNDCKVYGISAWNVSLAGAQQSNLLITRPPEYQIRGRPKVLEPAITVDDLEVAQFVYLLLSNEKLRDVIDTIGEKGVLILGRFTEDRKAVLDVLRDKLRELGFVPMLFDFERPTQRDFTETIKTLAGLSRFIIVDITNPKSSPLELQAIMPDYMIPFVPIIHEDEEPFTMFRDLQQKYGEWVLDVLKYDSDTHLLKVMEDAVVRPALEKANQLILKKAEAIRTRHVKDYLRRI